jgi:hypothetical protein
VAAEEPELSAAETLLLGRLMEKFGVKRYAMSRMLFDDTYACLAQAVRAYDAGAFLASCAMTRAALEGALDTFLTRKRMPGTDAGWIFHPIETSSGGVRSLNMTDLVDRVIQEGGLTGADRPKMDQVKEHGDLSLHVVQRHFTQTVNELAENAAGRQFAAPKQWPYRVDAREDITTTIELIGALLEKMGF